MLHLTNDNRKKIVSMLAHENKYCEIVKEIDCDPSTVSKEIKRNRIVSKDTSKGKNNFLCKKPEKWSYICGVCKHKYTDCYFM